MIELKNICWDTPDGKSILKNINMKCKDNRLIAISGPNGSGKTTLAKIIMGIEKPKSGQILLDGEDITHLDVAQRAQKGISFGFQQPVCFKGITIRKLLNIASQQELDENQLCSLLKKVGLCSKAYEDREIDSTLSGGEMKRIEIASVLARNTKAMVFDEPEAGIDLWSFSNLIEVFEQMRNQQNKTLIVISHQEKILTISDEIILIVDGQVKDHGPSIEMLSKMKKQQCPNGKECEALYE